MSHKNKRWSGRAPDATADAMFERALLGDDQSSRKTFDPRTDRKTQQLCQQVRRVLSGGCDDPALSDVVIESVEPMGNSSQLLVRVSAPDTWDLAPLDLMARLNERSAKLRAVVAQAISRKRAPGLTFVVIPHLPESLEGGMP